MTIVAWHWVICPRCGNLVLMRRGDPHVGEKLTRECQGRRHDH